MISQAIIIWQILSTSRTCPFPHLFHPLWQTLNMKCMIAWRFHELIVLIFLKNILVKVYLVEVSLNLNLVHSCLRIISNLPLANYTVYFSQPLNPTILALKLRFINLKISNRDYIFFLKLNFLNIKLISKINFFIFFSRIKYKMGWIFIYFRFKASFIPMKVWNEVIYKNFRDQKSWFFLLTF